MEHINPDMLEIILRHLRNEASLPEEKRLSDWLAQDPQHRTDLDEVRRLWEMTAPESSFEPNVVAAWEKVKARTTGFDMPTQTARVFRLPEFFWSAAASVALLVGFGTLIFQSTNPTAESWTQVASEGEVKKIWMPDSSLVWLNRNSSVSYSDFTGNRRLVKLQGEAFFEVRKNPDKPFQIEGRESVTAVLGTSFTITSEPGKPDQIEVVTGKVSFTARASEASKVTLTPGQKAVVQSNATIQTTQVEDPNGRSWQTGRLSFDNMP
jgi:ferric-dicitrate binding protein FerR (iron transport regulator)